MTFCEICIVLKGWQTVIGAVLGFGTLTLGALYSDRLTRKRDGLIRDQEARSVALGLYFEIRLISKALATLANDLGDWYIRNGARGDGVPAYVSENFVLPEPNIFKNMAPKIGMLPPTILDLVTRFYGYYGEALCHFPKVLVDYREGISYGVEWVLDPAISAIDEVQPALREIETLGGISKQAPAPDLGKARDAQDLEASMRPD